MLDKKHLSRLLARNRELCGSPQLRQGLVRLMEPRGKRRAKPRQGRVMNYEKMSEFNKAKQMSYTEITSHCRSSIHGTVALPESA
ncbi:MAG TPA: hypothetical protein VN890_02600 [Methylocella sp.]|nr:hypothetical protein [Methylocella sp.]